MGQKVMELSNHSTGSLLEKFMHCFRLILSARLATVPRYQLARVPVGVKRGRSGST